MIRKIATIFMVAGVLCLSACGNTKNGMDVESNKMVGEEIHNEEKPTPQVVKEQEKNEDQNTVTNVEEKTESGFTFPDEVCGIYAGFYNSYANQYFIIEKDKFYCYNQSQEAIVSSSEFQVMQGYNDPYRFSATSDNRTYWIRLDPQGAGVLEILDEFRNNIATIYNTKRDVLFGIPTKQYQSLDSLGEYGAIPMTDEIKAFLHDKITPDFFVVYNKEYSVFMNGKSHYCDLYEFISFDEYGYKTNKSGVIYSCNSEEVAQFIFNSNGGNSNAHINGNLVFIYYENNNEIRHNYLYSKQYNLSAHFPHLVYGEHCVKNRDLEIYYYMSKPYSISWGEQKIAVSKLLDKITARNVYSEDGTKMISLSGSGQDPNVSVVDNTYNNNLFSVNFLKVEGDMLIAYDNEYGLDKSDNYGGIYTNVIEFTQEGNLLKALLKRYEGIDQVTYDNYKDYSPVLETTIEVTK